MPIINTQPNPIGAAIKIINDAGTKIGAVTYAPEAE